jgi:hypothetical protein
VHHATAANGNQDVSVAAALLAGPGAKQEAVRQLKNYESTPLRSRTLDRIPPALYDRAE